MNFVLYTKKKLPVVLFATLAHASLLHIKCDVLKLGAYELKFVLAVNKSPSLFLGFSFHG